ncbi:MAG: glycosyltransferase family 39 protein [Planctomycetales bacterium]|nr:glycosyltransferase family 39 protein [Planctomycetales bacterium]
MNKPQWLLLGIILLLAFVLRLGAATYWHRTAQAEGRLFRLGDSHSYWTLASQLGRGLPYQYGGPDASIFRAPLYPLLLAPLTRWADEQQAVWWARVVGCALGTMAVAGVALLAVRLGGISAGLLAAALAAVYPSALGMSAIILSEALLVPLMVAHLLLWQSAWRSESKAGLATYAMLAGGIAGLAVLARPSWLLFAPFACMVGIVLGGGPERDSGRRRHALLFLYTLLGLCVVMSPWWLRNARLTGRFVPTTLQVGPSLYDGLHAGATGASDEGMAFMKTFVDEQQRADAAHRGPLPSTLEYRVNQRAQAAAIAWARQHPAEVVELAGRKFLRTWSLWPDGGELSSATLRLAITVSSFGILMLAIYAQFRVIRPISWSAGICWLPCLYFTLLHMVFVGSIRYREPAIFVLIAVAGCAIALRFPGRVPRASAGNAPPRVQNRATDSHN